jgi:hypothetical protein
VGSSSSLLDTGLRCRNTRCSRLLDLRQMGGSSRLSSVWVSWGWTRMTPAGPEMLRMKMLESRLAACELQTATRHELDVCSLRGSCSLVNEHLTQGVEASMQRDDGVACLIVLWSSQGLRSKHEKGYQIRKCRRKGGHSLLLVCPSHRDA